MCYGSMLFGQCNNNLGQKKYQGFQRPLENRDWGSKGLTKNSQQIKYYN